MTLKRKAYRGTVSTPYCEVLPPLSVEDREGLRLAIEAEGVLVPCEVTEDGRLLDGHNRRDLCPDAPLFAVPGSRGWSDARCRAYIYRSNRRRNLSLDKKKELRKAEKETCRELRAEDPKTWTQSVLAKTFGVSQKSVSEWQAVTTIIPSSNGSNRTAEAEKPDARTKINRAAQQEIIRRVEGGESQAQVASDYDVSQQTVSKTVKRHAARQKKLQAAEEGGNLITEAADFREGDFAEVAKSIPDASVQLIFTDPPYFADVLPLYRTLAEVAARVLVDGGSLITYLGHRLLPKVLEQMAVEGLTFYWPLACVHTGRSKTMPRTGQKVTWKPMLWFVKGKERLDTSVVVEDSVVSVQEKGTHAWQQGLPEALYYIGKLTTDGAVVFDPFCGGGTTAVAARKCGRKVITCDVDAQELSKARTRYVNEAVSQ